MRESESVPSISKDLQERLTALQEAVYHEVDFKSHKSHFAMESRGEEGVAIVGSAAGLSLLGVSLLNHALVFAPRVASHDDQSEHAEVCWSRNYVELVAPFEDRFRVLRWGINERLDVLEQAQQVDKPTSLRTYLIVAAVIMVTLVPWVVGIGAIWHWIASGNP